MKKTKILLGFLMAATIIGTSFTPTMANAAVKNDQSKNNSVVSNTVNVESYKISDKLTLDELVDEYAKDQEISVTEAKIALGAENTIETKARGEFYRTYTVRINAGASARDKYYPSVKFYCKTSEWDNYRGIKNVLNSSLIRVDNFGTTKGFSGTLYTNLENAHTIHYELNGDFLNNSTTTTTGGISIGIGESSTVTYSASTSSNKYSYICKDSNFDPFNYN